MRLFVIGAAAAAALAGLAPIEASARFSPQRIEAPTLVEEAACTTRRERIVRNGRVTYRTVRRCKPEPVCRTTRVRIVIKNGLVTYRTVRRCT